MARSMARRLALKRESTPWVHLGDEYNGIFGKLNVHFDVDLYV